MKTYQKITGSLCANSHPGSYCGQDAYNDMLIAGEANERNIHATGIREICKGGGVVRL